jgi:hypothetical protein
MPAATPVYNGFVLVAGHSINDTVIESAGKTYSYTGCSQQYIYVEGQAIFAEVIETETAVLYYAKLTQMDRYVSKITGKVGGTLTGNLATYLYDGLNSRYDYISQQWDIEHADYDKLYDYRDFEYKYKINKNKQKITQYHHLHVRLKDLYKKSEYVVVKGYEGILCCYLDRFNDIESTHATFITYFRALDDKHKKLFFGLLRQYGGIDKQWLKAEGTRAKQCQHAVNYDLSKIFELNVLENRVDTEIDWKVEKDHRVNVNTANFSYGEIYDACRELFSTARAEGRRPMKMSWADYWDQRAVIMPAGAVHSTYKEEIDLIKELPREAKNKKGLSANLGYKAVTDFLKREPKIESYVSTKYEWGKTRALYGCDYTSHVNADFGLMNCEDTFPSFIPTGSAANEMDVEKQLKPMKGVPLCYDYDDFNSQHSKSSMQAVIDAWLTVYCDQLTSDQIESAKWTSESIDSMYVNNKLEGVRYEAKGTLFSGWRLTTFINTALNYAYLANTGLKKAVYKSVHNGDDVYGSAVSLGHALKLIENAAARNVRAQATKMNIGTIAEFLRMDLRSKEKNMRQYLTRATATFVHSRVESDAPFSLRQLVGAYYTRYTEMCERGAIAKNIKSLYRKQLWFASKLFDVEKSIVNDLVEMDITAGGVVKGGAIRSYKLVEVKVLQNNEVVDIIKTRIRNGIMSYTTFLKRKFPTIKRAFNSSTVESNLMSMYHTAKTSIAREDVEKKEMYNERALKGAWTGLQGMTVVHRMRMGISNIVLAIGFVSPELASVLERSGDPIKWMRILL